MAIQLKDLKQKKLGEVVRELEYKDLLKLTMRISDDKQFQSAMAQIQQPEKGLTKDRLSKANNSGDNISMGEAMLYLIGEYLITDWDVEVSEGKIAPINGDNFIALCASIGDDDENIEFVGFISDNFTEMTSEFKDQGVATKKKPSRSTTGKKVTPA
jgi:hypothetical protein